MPDSDKSVTGLKRFSFHLKFSNFLCFLVSMWNSASMIGKVPMVGNYKIHVIRRKFARRRIRNAVRLYNLERL